MTEMHDWSMFKGYLADFYTYPVSTPTPVSAVSKSGNRRIGEMTRCSLRQFIISLDNFHGFNQWSICLDKSHPAIVQFKEASS